MQANSQHKDRFCQEALTELESDRFSRLEIEFEKVCQTWVEGSAILLEIRDSRLYRERFRTFEEYCNTRWNLTRQHVNRLIAAGEVVKNLEPLGSIPSERQARQLTDLNPKKQREVFAEAKRTAPDGKLTARHISETKKQYVPEKLSSWSVADSNTGKDIDYQIGWLVTENEKNMATSALKPSNKEWQDSAIALFKSLRDRKITQS